MLTRDRETIYNQVSAVDLRSPHMAVRIPAVLRQIRQARGLKLSDVADLCGTSPQNIQRLETGGMTMSLEWLDKLVRALDLRAADVFLSERIEELEAVANRRMRMRVVADLRAYADRLEEGSEL